MKQGIFMDKHTKTFPPSTKQADSMDKLLPGPFPSMKQGTFMDKHTKTSPPSTKQADSMDKLLPGPLPSMKQGTFMDKHTKTFPPSMKQTDSMDKLLPGPPSVHETWHFHGQTHQNIPSTHETGRFHGQTPPRTPAPSAQSRRSEPFGEARAACSERLASVFASRAASPPSTTLL